MKTIIKILCVLTLVFGLSSCGYERIDAGYEGIKVNLYGDPETKEFITQCFKNLASGKGMKSLLTISY